MARTLTTAVSDETVKGGVRLAYLVDLALDSGTLRMWTGRRDLSYGGNTYTGTGTLADVSAIGETMDIQAAGVRLELNGVSASVISIALGEHYQGRTATVRLGFFDDSWALIADPVVMFVGRMDTMEISDAGELCSITLNVENRLVDFQRTSEVRYWTDQEQQRRFTGDKGLEFVEALQDKVIYWGRIQPGAKKSGSTAPSGGTSGGTTTTGPSIAPDTEDQGSSFQDDGGFNPSIGHGGFGWTDGDGGEG